MLQCLPLDYWFFLSCYCSLGTIIAKCYSIAGTIRIPFPLLEVYVRDINVDFEVIPYHLLNFYVMSIAINCADGPRAS